jgi:hypothetical protein
LTCETADREQNDVADARQLVTGDAAIRALVPEANEAAGPLEGVIGFLDRRGVRHGIGEVGPCLDAQRGERVCRGLRADQGSDGVRPQNGGDLALELVGRALDAQLDRVLFARRGQRGETRLGDVPEAPRVLLGDARRAGQHDLPLVEAEQATRRRTVTAAIAQAVADMDVQATAAAGGLGGSGTLFASLSVFDDLIRSTPWALDAHLLAVVAIAVTAPIVTAVWALALALAAGMLGLKSTCRFGRNQRARGTVHDASSLGWRTGDSEKRRTTTWKGVRASRRRVGGDHRKRRGRGGRVRQRWFSWHAHEI